MEVPLEQQQFKVRQKSSRGHPNPILGGCDPLVHFAAGPPTDFESRLILSLLAGEAQHNISHAPLGGCLAVYRAAARFESCEPRQWRERTDPSEIEFLEARQFRDRGRKVRKRIAAEIKLPQVLELPDRFR